MRIILTFIMIVFISISLNANNFEFYTAKQGLKAADNFASKQFDNYNLIGISAINFKKNFYGTQYDFNFNIDNGKSNCWVYYFANQEKKSEIIYIPIVKIGSKYINFKKYCSNLGLENLAIAPKKLTNFVDSDKLSNNLLNNSNLSKLKLKNNDSEIDLVAIFNNQMPTISKVNEPVWVMMYSDKTNNESFACYSNALNGETLCEDYKNSNNNSEFVFYPKIENNKVSVKPQSKINDISIIDQIGNTIHATTNYDPIESLLEVDLSDLENGVYFIIVKDKLDKSIIKYIVE